MKKNAHIYEKELFAVIWAYSKFKQYIQGHHLRIQTDNRAVQFLKKMKEKKDKLRRWAIEIDSWDTEIVFRPGKDNVEADALSRAPIPDYNSENLFEEAEDDKMYTPIFAFALDCDLRERIRVEQDADATIQSIIATINSQPKGEMAAKYVLDAGILKRRIQYDSKNLRPEVLVSNEQTTNGHTQSNQCTKQSPS